jgi:hypothetical protein
MESQQGLGEQRPAVAWGTGQDRRKTEVLQGCEWQVGLEGETHTKEQVLEGQLQDKPGHEGSNKC